MFIDESTDTVAFGKAIADETRQRIMQICCCTRLTVGEIAARAGVAQPTASHHLAILRRASLVHVEVEGRETYYSLNQEMFTVCCGRLIQRFAPGKKNSRTLRRKSGAENS
jgi:DNA-binding transcriptional ArsR family regulator